MDVLEARSVPNSWAGRGNATLRQSYKSFLRVPTACVLRVPIQDNATEHSSCCVVFGFRDCPGSGDGFMRESELLPGAS